MVGVIATLGTVLKCHSIGRLRNTAVEVHEPASQGCETANSKELSLKQSGRQPLTPKAIFWSLYMQHGKYIPDLYVWTPVYTHHTQKTHNLFKNAGKRIRKFYYTKFYILTITLLEISKKFWHKVTCLTHYFPNFFLFRWTPSSFLQNTLVGHADLNNFLQCDLKNTMESDKSTVSSAIFLFLPFSKRPSLIFFEEGKLNWSDLGLICLFGYPTWIVVQSLLLLWVMGSNLMTILLFPLILNLHWPGSIVPDVHKDASLSRQFPEHFRGISLL